MKKFDQHPPRVTLAMVATLAVAACNQAQARSHDAGVEDDRGSGAVRTAPKD